MDLQKLPKFSTTPPAAPPAPDDAASRGAPPPPPAYATPTGYPMATDPVFASAGSAWLSLIIGIICLLLGQNFLRWLLATATGRPHATGVIWNAGPKAGQPVDYFELQGGTAWTDMGVFLMGVALLIDGGVMLWLLRGVGRWTVGLATLALGVTALAVLVNLGVAADFVRRGGLPLFSLLAVAIGGYMLFEYAGLLKVLRGTRRRAL